MAYNILIQLLTIMLQHIVSLILYVFMKGVCISVMFLLKTMTELGGNIIKSKVSSLFALCANFKNLSNKRFRRSEQRLAGNDILSRPQRSEHHLISE